jgi:hypothetical protein
VTNNFAFEVQAQLVDGFVFYTQLLCLQVRLFFEGLRLLLKSLSLLLKGSPFLIREGELTVSFFTLFE